MGHEVQVIIGDIAHNLRSALDHVTWQLVLANGGEPKEGSGGTTFPILLKKPRARLRIVGGVSADARDAIEAAQPYNAQPIDRNRHPLAALGHVSNTDKHREPAIAHRVFDNLVSWSGTGDTTKPWVAPIKAQNPTVDSVEIVLAEVPEVLGDGGASADYEVRLDLRGGVQEPLYLTLTTMVEYVRQLVDKLVASSGSSSAQMEAS
jgi:hypothetical protein